MAVASTQAVSADTLKTGKQARTAIRSGGYRGPTSGLAPGYVQGNLAILPGDPRLPKLAEDLDIRTDVPRYRVFQNGELIDEPYDIRNHWRDDLVTFALGCSFSFEGALIEDGMELRHIT